MRLVVVSGLRDIRERIPEAFCGNPLEFVRQPVAGEGSLATLAQKLAAADLVIIGAHETEPCPSIALVERIRSLNASVPVIVLSRAASVDHAILALRAGVTDYFRAPWSEAELVRAVNRIAARSGANEQGSAILGRSPLMKQVTAAATRVAASESNVLITGETGTGKELMAQYIHRNSPRHSGPFACINCAAIPDGLLEAELFGHERGAFTGATGRAEGKLRMANGGVVFLDEVGDMSLHGQARLLRVIENREVYPVGGIRKLTLDLRVLAATNQDLEQRVAQGSFRADLLFRLNVVRVHLPPLRERRSDIPDLLSHFVAHFNRNWGRRIDGFAPEACDLLQRYDWPGNVRELRNVVEAAYVNSTGRTIGANELPVTIREPCGGASNSSTEKQRLITALFETNWNVSRVAAKLQWSRMTVYRKLARYRIRRQAV